MEGYQEMYEGSIKHGILDGEKSEGFNVEQGVAQGCSLFYIRGVFRWGCGRRAIPLRLFQKLIILLSCKLTQ